MQVIRINQPRERIRTISRNLHEVESHQIRLDGPGIFQAATAYPQIPLFDISFHFGVNEIPAFIHEQAQLITDSIYKTTVERLRELGFTNIIEHGTIEMEGKSLANKVNIGIILPGIGDSILVALQGKKLRSDANFLLIPPNHPSLLFKGNKAFAQYAVYTRWEGNRFDIASVRFKYPVPLHAFLDARGINEGEKLIVKRGIPILNTAELFEFVSDKIRTKLALLKYGIATPQFMVFEKGKDPNLEEIRNRIREFLTTNPGKGFVVKPNNCSQGTGVRLFEENEIEKGVQFIADSLKYREFILVEVRSRSFPFYEAGQRMDANIRMIIVGGREAYAIESSEVRYDTVGSHPINKSRGASIMEVKEYLKRLGLTSKKADNMKEKLISAGKKIVEALSIEFNGYLPGVLGLDLIINEEGEIDCIEVNSGVIGGLGSLAKIRKPINGKLSPAIEIALRLMELGEKYLTDFPIILKNIKESLSLPDNLAIGEAHLLLDQFDKAIPIFQELLEKPQETPVARICLYLGLCLFNMEQPMKALEYLLKAFELEPQNVSVLRGLANTYGCLKEYENEIKFNKLVLELEPENILALRRIGLLYGELNHPEIAAEYFEELVKINPTSNLAKGCLLEMKRRIRARQASSK